MSATFMFFSSVKYVLCCFISTFRSMCVVPNMAVFCSSLISCFPGMLFRYCLGDFEMVLVAPIIICIYFGMCYYFLRLFKSLKFEISV